MLLEDLQRSMIAAIDLGPDHVADAAFLGGRAAALRGLSVHANTISHARLVAIEDTFPRTRERLGHGEFNALSRDYLDLPGVAARPHAKIGARFAQFLADAGKRDAAALASFEWAWLESYHAEEGEALELSALAGMSEEELLRTVVARHPAARMVGAVRDEALEGEVPGLADAAGILITRPGADVLVASALAAMASQFELLAEPSAICNLLESCGEFEGEDSLQALFAMLNAGSFVLQDTSLRPASARPDA